MELTLSKLMIIACVFQFKRPVITGNDQTTKGNIDSGKGATGTPHNL